MDLNLDAGGIGSIFNFAKGLVDRIWPDPATKAKALLDLEELHQKGELAKLASETELLKGQLEINKVEASSTSMFIAGARPFILWTCGVAFVYAAILEPLARFVAQVMYSYKGPFPVIDTMLTLQVLMGLLGLGAMRTYEKRTGTEGNR